jgi:hypothetical protein
MKTRALWLLIPWLLFAAAATGWVVYWHVVAATAEARIQRFVAAQNQQGARVAMARMVRHGFPVLLRLELQEIAYAPARGGWSVASARVDLNIQLLNPEHLILEAKAPIAITRANGAVTNLAAERLIASLRGARGELAVVGLEADNLTLDDPAAEGVLGARKLVLNLRPDARAAGNYQLAFEATALSLPRPVRSFEAFGKDVERLRAAIVIEHGAALLAGAAGDPLGPWREAGGRLRFEALELGWGPLQASGHGAGGLDAERRLEGELALPIEHPAPIFTALAGAPNVNESARRALGLLALSYRLSGDDISLDVEAQGGVLRLEGLGVRTLPPVY